MVSSKGQNPVDGPEPSKKMAKQEHKFLSLLEDVLDKLDTTLADISPQTKKYRSTFVLMLIRRKIPLGGRKFTVHSYLY